jgi:transposase
MAREVARIVLMFGDYSDRYIEKITLCTHQTIGRIRRKLEALGVQWKDIERLPDSDFQILLYPRVKQRISQRILPNFDDIYRELNKKGKRRKSLSVLHDEHRLKYGKLAYKRSRFNELVRENLASRHVCMKQLYQPGEALFIDYAGTRLKYSRGGKEKLLNVFVGCLGYSKKLFAFATADMTSKSWILGLGKALENFGGVPEVIQFDNAKAMVTKASRIALLNDNVRAFAQHYGCICDTSRVATPTDNPNAEAGVKFITQRILVPMNSDLSFFSVDEVNIHLLKEVEQLNRQPFQKRPESRDELFYSTEKPCLKPLPSLAITPFVTQKTMKVPSTYLIPYQGHEYSVPYTLAGKDITVRITDTEFLVYFDGDVVTKHTLSEMGSGFTRLEAHMKPEHLAEERKSKGTFMAWAKDIGVDVEKIIEKQYEETSNLKSRVVGKHCIELQKLCDTCGQDIFTKACHHAIERDWYEPDEIKLVIRAKAWELPIEAGAIEHSNIRGKNYFGGLNHE